MRFDTGRDGCDKGRPDAAVMVERPITCATETDGGFTTNAPDSINGRFVDFLASFLGSSSSKATKGPVELDDLAGRKKSDAINSVPSPDRNVGAIGEFDVCREYSCTTDDYDDADLDSPSLVTDPSAKECEGTPLWAFVLGKAYRLLQDHNTRRDDECQLFWFTYRCEFPEIVPYGLRSDAGWGCMLRSAQMLLGQALRMHLKSRDWRPPQHCSVRRTDPFMRSILTWFADFPSTDQCYYSLHNMVAAGLKYDKLPGEWFGPTTVCCVLRDLVEMHERRQQANKILQLREHKRIFRVHVASQGTVYRDSIHDLMTRESREKISKEAEKKHKVKPQAHPLDLDWEVELVEAIGNVEWDTGLLLLVPVRLGLNSFNGDYGQAVAYTFSISQSVGVLGGRIRGARWFYGAVSDGSKVFGLDPHTVQTAPRSRTARINGKLTTTVDLQDEYVLSCQTKFSEVLSLERIDPSIAFGFYCRDQADLESLLKSVREWKQQNPGQPELFSVEDSAPFYAANVSSAVGDLSLGSSSLLDDDDNDNDEKDDGSRRSDDDDDDFVML